MNLDMLRIEEQLLDAQAQLTTTRYQVSCLEHIIAGLEGFIRLQGPPKLSLGFDDFYYRKPVSL